MHMSTCGSELLTSALGVTKKHFFVPAMNMSTCGSERLHRTGERGTGERGDGEEEDGEKGQDPYMSGA